MPKDFTELLQRLQPPQQRSRRIELRVTEAEEQLFRAAAAARGATISEWLRTLGRTAAKSDLMKRRGKR